MAKTKVGVRVSRNYQRFDVSVPVDDWEDAKESAKALLMDTLNTTRGEAAAKVEVIFHFKNTESQRDSEEFEHMDEDYASLGATDDFDKALAEIDSFTDYLQEPPDYKRRRYSFAQATAVTITLYIDKRHYKEDVS